MFLLLNTIRCISILICNHNKDTSLGSSSPRATSSSFNLASKTEGERGGKEVDIFWLWDPILEPRGLLRKAWSIREDIKKVKTRYYLKLTDINFCVSGPHEEDWRFDLFCDIPSFSKDSEQTNNN